MTDDRSTVIDAFTVRDLQQLRTREGLRYEILDGELVVTPSPAPRHQEVLGRLYRLVCEAIDDRGHGQTWLAPLDVELSPVDVFEPDLFVTLSTSRCVQQPRRMQGPPDLAIEILSKTTARRDRGRKKDRYALHGVRELWLVDPHAGNVEQFELQTGGYLRVGLFDREIALRIVPDAMIDLRRAW